MNRVNVTIFWIEVWLFTSNCVGGDPRNPPLSAALGFPLRSTDGRSSLATLGSQWTQLRSLARSPPLHSPLLSRNTLIVFSQVILKLPSIPLTSSAFTSILVSLNGTFSGNLLLCMATSKQSPKSMWSSFPLVRLSIRLDGCRSPSPRM